MHRRRLPLQSLCFWRVRRFSPPQPTPTVPHVRRSEVPATAAPSPVPSPQPTAAAMAVTGRARVRPRRRRQRRLRRRRAAAATATPAATPRQPHRPAGASHAPRPNRPGLPPRRPGPCARAPPRPRARRRLARPSISRTRTSTGSRPWTNGDGDPNFDWGLSSPDPSLPVDHFSARWTRSVSLPAGRWRSMRRSHDGARGCGWPPHHRSVAHHGRHLQHQPALSGGNHNLRVDYTITPRGRRPVRVESR